MNVRSALQSCSAAFALAGIEDARRESYLLLGHVLDRTKAYFLAHPEAEIGAVDAARFEALYQRRSRGEPLSYVTGSANWLDFRLIVNRNVLIPRPETELLADMAIQALRGGDHHGDVRVVDVGTGSGAIALAIARACPSARVTGTDISPAALGVARRNAKFLKCPDVSFVQTDLLCGVTGRIDLLVANLPYIPSTVVPTLATELAFEPRSALDGGADGLAPFRALFSQAPAYMIPGSLLLLECGHDQAAAVAELAASTWPDAAIMIQRDYASIERFVRVAVR